MPTREPSGSFHWLTSLDNHEPVRAATAGLGLRYPADDTRAETVTLTGIDDLKAPENAVYLLDDGRTVTVWYVAGWKLDDTGPDRRLHLQPFPTNPDGRTRPYSGRVIDFDSWRLGPRRAYHLKVTEGTL